MTPEAKKRIKELEARLNNAARLTTEEYLEHLHQIRKNCAILLEIQTLRQEPRTTGAWHTLMEKCHYLIDSVEGPKDDTPKELIVRFATKKELG
jgi:hypothetical protein